MKNIAKNYILINILLSIINMGLLITGTDFWYWFPLLNALLLVLWYFIVVRNSIDNKLFSFYLYLTVGVFLLFSLLLKLKGGQLSSPILLLLFVPLFPFLPFLLFAVLLPEPVYYLIGATLLLHCLILFICLKGKDIWKQALTGLLAIGLCCVFSIHTYSNRDEIKYGGHGFKYMNGYSSTDFTGYHVYSEPTKLVTLDHVPETYITEESDMPIMDGVEACYPVYAAVAKAIYKDIDKIELEYLKQDKVYYNGKIVTFTNTVRGYDRLVDGECDMLFGARPSKQQIDYATSMNVEYKLTEIGKEAFVFFVEKDNPVDSLTSEQLRAIYHGDITNWKDVGGKNENIVAFQRPEGSGSQTMMLYFMKDVSLKEPKTYEKFSAMGGIVKQVANYNNEDGALGYSFRYFIEGLMEEENVKLLGIDGIAPTIENIRNGSYPLTTGLYCITRANDPNPNVRKVLDFLLSEDGQYIIEKTGYAPLSE